MRQKPQQTPLIPPDLKQCQAEKPNGCTFMTLGGQPGLIRCTAVPTWIAQEIKSVDRRRGSMSLCDDCRKVMKQQLGPGYATFTPIKPVKPVKPKRTIVRAHPDDYHYRTWRGNEEGDPDLLGPLYWCQCLETHSLFHGDTREEALTHCREVVEVTLAHWHKHKVQPPPRAAAIFRFVRS